MQTIPRAADGIGRRTMKRFCLEVAYDGTAYHGWQYQPGRETIEGVLNKQLSALTKENIEVIGASRTDAGVHAFGNIAVFDSETSIPGDRLCPALNTMLPKDIRIMKSYEVADDFHPRHVEGASKTYEYHILNTKQEIPTKRLYSWHVDYDLDIAKMKTACMDIVGTHDFAGFCSTGSQALTTERTVLSAEVRVEGDEIVFGITGTGFLYNMVRILAGTLVDIGRGRLEPSVIKTVLDTKDRTWAGQTAPAEGLFLIGYSFAKK